MEQEYFFFGYCRSIDGSRAVSVEDRKSTRLNSSHAT